MLSHLAITLSSLPSFFTVSYLNPASVCPTVLRLIQASLRMESFNAVRLLFPKPMSSGLGDQPSLAQEASLAPITAAPAQHVPRQPRSASKTDQEWEAQRQNFQRLYVGEDLTLKVAMEEMEKQYSFKASYVLFRRHPTTLSARSL